MRPDSVEDPKFASTDYDADDFKPIKRLGYGDMGTVFLANLRRTGQPFAMKVMNKEVVKARDNGYRVQRELAILSALDHSFVPHLFAHFESKKHLYLVMDYCPGGDMNVLRQRQPERKFSENAARFYAAEVLLAIEYLHKIGVIYRDLKPENVLIQEDGHIMLTDFDLSLKMEKAAASQVKETAKSSKLANKLPRTPFMCASPMSVDVVCASQKAVDVKPSHRKTKKIFPSEMKAKRSTQSGLEEIKSQSFVGTEEYVAPEMILGSGHGMALDWWTFGILLYEMVYGCTPFKGKNRRDTFYNILSKEPFFPGAWTPARDLISKLLVKDPSKRLGSAGGAEDIKSHCFFQGVIWSSIQHVSRPPWVPPPLVLEEGGSELVIDELLKQTVPLHHGFTESTDAFMAKKQKGESNYSQGAFKASDGDIRSSSFASTITEDFSDTDSKKGPQSRQHALRPVAAGSFGEF